MLSGGVNLDFLAEWWCNDTDSISGVGPEITIISKRLLQGFCEFLICEYFDYTNKQELIRCFYQNISTGVHSGISDMHALATFLNLAQGNYFNLRNLTDFRLIGNLTHYQDNANSNDLDWSISFRSGSQIRRENNRIFKLAGTHFQGSAKLYIPSNIENGVVSAEGSASKLKRLGSRINSYGLRILNGGPLC